MNGPLAIVLAAGKGTRMNSDLPKVLCQALGRPLIDYVLDALEQAGMDRVVVVVGHRSDDVRRTLAGRCNVQCVEQTPQLGTGHAVMMCRDILATHAGPVAVVAGDSPLIQTESLRQLLDEFHRAHPACILGTLHKADPQGLGRIQRDSAGRFVAIVEQKDATDVQRQITEVNMSTYMFDCRELLYALDHIRNDNRQREFYLTDCPGVLQREHKNVRALAVLKPCEALSVNTLDELRIVEAEMRKLGYRCAN